MLYPLCINFKAMKKILVVLGLLGFSFSAAIFLKNGEEPVPVPPSVQRTGDAKAGFIYLTTGDYLRSGIPLSYFKMGFGKSSPELFKQGRGK